MRTIALEDRVERVLQYEKTIVNGCVTQWLALVKDLPNVSPKELRPFAADILTHMALLFRSIGAEEVLDVDPENSLRRMNGDLAGLNACTIPDWSSERALLASCLVAKIKVFGQIDALSAGASVPWGN